MTQHNQLSQFPIIDFPERERSTFRGMAQEPGPSNDAFWTGEPANDAFELAQPEVRQERIQAITKRSAADLGPLAIRIDSSSE